MDKTYYTYDDLKLDVSVIHNEYMLTYGTAPDFVVGLSRGGLVPAVHLSHMFNCPLIPLRYSTRDFTSSDLVGLEDIIKTVNSGLKILIVDDIFDTGETLMEIAKFIQGDGGSKVPYATLITNRLAQAHEPFVMSETLFTGVYVDKGENDWVVFPWEENKPLDI